MRRLRFIFLFGLIAACSSKKEADNNDISRDDLMDEVMNMHDEAMIPWAEIHELNKRLQSKIEALNSPQTSTEESEKMQQTSQALEEADDAMMSWMRQFNTYEFQDMTDDSAIVILQKEKASIEKVYNQVHSSVNSAKVLLKGE
jgi:hypothetical protein